MVRSRWSCGWWVLLATTCVVTSVVPGPVSGQEVEFQGIQPELDPEEVAAAKQSVKIVATPPKGCVRKQAIGPGRGEGPTKSPELVRHATDHLVWLAAQAGVTHLVLPPKMTRLIPPLMPHEYNGWSARVDGYYFRCPTPETAGAARPAKSTAASARRAREEELYGGMSQAFNDVVHRMNEESVREGKKKATADVWRMNAAPDMASRFLQLAEEHATRGEHDKAVELAKRAREIRELAFGPNDAATLEAAQLMRRFTRRTARK